LINDSPRQKRALQELQVTPSKRRKSIGFDMVRIVASPPRQDSSGIPAPLTQSHQHIRDATERNARISTRIPKSSTDMDLLQVKKLIKLNQRLPLLLLKPSSAASVAAPAHTSLRTRMDQIESTHHSSIQSLSATQTELDAQIKLLREESLSLEVQIAELKRELKKALNHIGQQKISISLSRRKFELLEENVMKNVLHRERLSEIQLTKLRNDLEAEFAQLKSQTQEELNTAERYTDKEVAVKLAKLQHEKQSLKTQLDESKERSNRVLTQELLELQKKLESFLEGKTSESKELSCLYEEKQKRLNEVRETHAKLTTSIVGMDRQTHELDERAKLCKSSSLNYSSVEQLLTQEIGALKASREALDQETCRQELKLEQIRRSRNMAAKAYEAREDQRNRLHNSIMDYENRLRIFVKPLGIQCDDLSDADFDRLFQRDDTDDYVMTSFTPMTDSAVHGEDCSVVFAGSHSLELFYKAIKLAYDSLNENTKKFPEWSFEVSIRQGRLGEGAREPTSEVTLRSMADMEEFLSTNKSEALDKKHNKCVPHFIFSVKGTRVLMPHAPRLCGSITYIDLTLLPTLRQCNILREPLLPSFTESSIHAKADIVQQINWCYFSTKFLILASISSGDESRAQLKEVCTMIRSTSSNYKLKHWAQ
jgi:hypothetical protein